MAIEEKNGFWFGDCPADAVAFLQGHIGKGQWAYTHSSLNDTAGQGKWVLGPKVLSCSCGSEVGYLETDFNDRFRNFICVACKHKLAFVPDATDFGCEEQWDGLVECECGSESVNVASGIFLREHRDRPVAMVSIRCNSCGFLECVAVRDLAPQASMPLDDAVWSRV